MNHRTIAVVSAAALAVTGGLVGTVVWLSQPSYNDVVKDCQTALAAQMEAGGEGRPSECRDVKEDDYSAILMNQIMDDNGWLDGNGDFDKNKWLDDVTDEQP
jgi:hypothetical protein